MKNTINKIAFKIKFEDKYSKDIIDNTVLFLEIARKYGIKELGIGYWKSEFKKSYPFIHAFYKDLLNTNKELLKVEGNCFSNSVFRRDDDNENILKGFPKIWKVCEEFDEINKTEYNRGCGNSGQHQFITKYLINGIWKYSNKGWDLINK